MKNKHWQELKQKICNFLMESQPIRKGEFCANPDCEICGPVVDGLIRLFQEDTAASKEAIE